MNGRFFKFYSTLFTQVISLLILGGALQNAELLLISLDYF